jgi:hypothetical protein
MKVNDFYQTESKWLKAADLQGRKHRVVVDAVEVVEFKEKTGNSRKVGLTLRGKQKGLLLNKTNAKIIAAQHGDDMDAWVGQTINIYPTTTDFGGEMVECIRVEQVVPEASPDDEIPF